MNYVAFDPCLQNIHLILVQAFHYQYDRTSLSSYNAFTSSSGEDLILISYIKVDLSRYWILVDTMLPLQQTMQQVTLNVTEHVNVCCMSIPPGINVIECILSKNWFHVLSSSPSNSVDCIYSPCLCDTCNKDVRRFPIFPPSCTSGKAHALCNVHGTHAKNLFVISRLLSVLFISLLGWM